MKIAHMLKFVYLGLILSVIGIAFASGNSGSSSSTTSCTQTSQACYATIYAICGIITTISTIIAIFSLVMFILGGTLYALAHFLPAAGNFRSGLQGWGMGMIIGGIVALILYVAAPFIVSTIANIGASQGSATTGFGISGLNIPNCQQYLAAPT